VGRLQVESSLPQLEKRLVSTLEHISQVRNWFQAFAFTNSNCAATPRGREKVNVAAVAGEIMGGSRGKLPPGITEVECEPPL
jgi:hypothetical protein